MNQATHAHAFRTSAADKRRGFGYVVYLTKGPGMTLGDILETLKVANLRAAKQLVKARSLVAHNF